MVIMLYSKEMNNDSATNNLNSENIEISFDIDNYNPAEDLEGQQLLDTWTVLSKNQSEEGATGGFFSVGYLVENREGKKGFLKAFNILDVLKQQSANTSNEDERGRLRLIRNILDAYDHECDMLEKCRQASRIVTPLNTGIWRSQRSSVIPVPFLIFDLAEGDIRSKNINTTFDMAFRLRCLHNIAVGLQQLHQRGIAHQDLKPSNILLYPDESSKIADLGRSIDKNGCMYDNYLIAGDRNYAPPELLYRSNIQLPWAEHRLGCDLYQLGSLICYIFLDFHINNLLKASLHESMYPENYITDNAYEQVLPFLIANFESALQNFQEAIDRDYPQPLGYELTSLIRHLCYPDYRQRGHIKNFKGYQSQHGLERFISRLALLTATAEYNNIGRLNN